MIYFINEQYLTYSLKCLKVLKEIKSGLHARFEPVTSRMRSGRPNHWTMLTTDNLGSLIMYIYAQSSVKETNSCSVKMLVSLY